MNNKKGSRNGDYFVREAQESQAWAAEHVTGRGGKSSLQGCRRRESNREKKKKKVLLYNVGIKPKACKAPMNTARLEIRYSFHYTTSGAGNQTSLFSVSITKQEQGMGLILPACSFLLCMFASIE